MILRIFQVIHEKSFTMDLCPYTTIQGQPEKLTSINSDVLRKEIASQ